MNFYLLVRNHKAEICNVLQSFELFVTLAWIRSPQPTVLRVADER